MSASAQSAVNFEAVKAFMEKLHTQLMDAKIQVRHLRSYKFIIRDGATTLNTYPTFDDRCEVVTNNVLRAQEAVAPLAAGQNNEACVSLVKEFAPIPGQLAARIEKLKALNEKLFQIEFYVDKYEDRENEGKFVISSVDYMEIMHEVDAFDVSCLIVIGAVNMSLQTKF